MNQMKKTTSLFPFALAVLLAFFWSGCGDSDNSVSNGGDSSMLDSDVEDIAGSSSSLKKNVSSSSKKQESSSSLEKASILKDLLKSSSSKTKSLPESSEDSFSSSEESSKSTDNSSSSSSAGSSKSTEKSSSSSVESSKSTEEFSSSSVESSKSTEESSSSSVESSSSEVLSGIYSVLSGRVRTFEESRDFLMQGEDGTKRGMSTFITTGTGSVMFDDEGAFVVECNPDDFECFAESYLYDFDDISLENVIGSKDDAFIEFETSSEGVINSGSYNLMFMFRSRKLGKNYSIRFVYPGEGFDDMEIKHAKENINKESAIECGEGNKKFDVYIRDFVTPSEIIVVTDSPVKPGGNRMNLSEPLRDFDKNCESLINYADTVYFKSDSLMRVGVGVILLQNYGWEEIGDTARVAVWNINVPDGQSFKKD